MEGFHGLLGTFLFLPTMAIPLWWLVLIFGEKREFVQNYGSTGFCALFVASVIWFCYFVGSFFNPLFGFLGLCLGGFTALRVFPRHYFELLSFHRARKAAFDALQRQSPEDVERRLNEATENPSRPQPPYVRYLVDVRFSRLVNALIARIYEQDRVTVPFPEMPAFDLTFTKSDCDHYRERFERVFDASSVDEKRWQLIHDNVHTILKTILAPLLPQDGPFRIGLAELLDRPNYERKQAQRLFDTAECRALGIGTTLLRLAPEDTELDWLFRMGLPWGIPANLRIEHGVIVAGTGGGKTQLLESLVLADVDETDPPGVIVIDSKGEMIERIAHLDVFHPDHGRLRDRLIVIDHNDQPALNLFDIDEATVAKRFNHIQSLMEYFFGSLFDSKMSDQMGTLFIPLLHIVLRKKGATLQTLIDLVRNPRLYPDVLARIPDGARNFILNHYNDTFYTATKSAIITRLSRLSVDDSLSALFNAPRNSVDLGAALAAGKIVLVNTDAAGLGDDRSAILGRYFIAQAYAAGLSRGSRQGKQRRQIHIYIDECAPYLDHKIEKMLTTVRSYGVGVMMAFQGAWQMTGYERVIQGNTSIKILGHLRDEADAKIFASSMRTSVEFLMDQRRDPHPEPKYGCFGCYTTSLNKTTSIQLWFFQLDRRDQMSERDYDRLRQLNRSRLVGGPVFDAPPDDFTGTTIDGEAEEMPNNIVSLPRSKHLRPPKGEPDVDTDPSPDW